MAFEDYYKGLGFDAYPFGVFTSEAEKRQLSSLFLRPDNYSVILEGLKNTSAIIFGERGTGKTALSLFLQGELGIENQLICRIEEFSELKLNFSNINLYSFLTEHIASSFFIKISEKPSILWKYTKDERLDLSMYLSKYVSASSKEQLKEKINKIQNSAIKRSFINAYNYGRVFLNYGIKAATKMASDALTKHFSSLPEFDLGDSEYFKKFEEHIDQSFSDQKKEFLYLSKLCKLIKRHEFSKIYVFIDKIDEDTRFENDSESVSEYIKGFAENNQILTNEDFHLILFLWATPFNAIRSNVRTQKLTLEKLDWPKSQLEQVVNRRLQAFSIGKVNALTELLEGCSQEQIDSIFHMCNENPRDLWHILDTCFKTQFSLDSTQKIGPVAIEQGIQSFVEKFNYYEYYPKKANSRANSMDVYAYIKHLLKLDSIEFTKDKLNSMAGTGSSTNNYVLAMENMGLIKKTSGRAQGGSVLYEIRDPKVRYAMTHHLSISL